jgi:hypothetical protein
MGDDIGEVWVGTVISVTLVGCALVQDDGNWNKAAKLQQGCNPELAACTSALFGT